MIDISVEIYANAKVYRITVGKRKLFQVKMHDVQQRFGVTNMSDLVRKKSHGVF